MLMNCRNKISAFCICTVTVIGPKWALLCALSLKHFFLCIFFSAPSLKNYNLVSPPNPAEVCDVDFGLQPSYWPYIRWMSQHTKCHGKEHFTAIRKCSFCREGIFPLQYGFWGVPWLSGKIPFLSSTGVMEEHVCVVTEEFSWTSRDRPLTPVEGTKPHSAVVLIF